MTLSAHYHDYSRRESQSSLPASSESAFLDMKPGVSTFHSSTHPLEHHFGSAEHEDFLSKMFATESSHDTAANAAKQEPVSSWSEGWPEDSANYFNIASTSEPIVFHSHSYGSTALDAASEFLQSISLSSSPASYDFSIDHRDHQHVSNMFSQPSSSDMFSQTPSSDIFSMDSLNYSAYQSELHTPPEALTDGRTQAMSYIPQSPISDISSSSYTSMPSLTRSTSSLYSGSSYPPTPTSSSSSCSPTINHERPSPEAKRPLARPALTKAQTVSEGNALRPHPCLYPDCGRWFTRSYTRNVHMLTHRRSNDPKPFACTVPGCTEGFSRKHDRLRHEVRQHGRGSSWRCPLCTTSRFYSSQTTLERHLSEKHNKDG